MKKYNFNAGPSMLPREVIEATAQQCLDFNGSGLSLMEISHRAKDFQPVVDEAVALVKELLQVPEGYSVIFLGGGASLEFCMIPYNFLIKKAAYLNTGVWAKKAMKEAKLFGEVVEVASSADANYTFIPKDWTVPADADYLHITTNNTIYGTEIRKDLDVSVPLIADMSSDFMSRPIDVAKYDAIYAGAQKNLSMAGVTIVILKDEKLGNAPRPIPTMLDYRTHVEKGSMFNTPPVVPIYCALENLRWIKRQGGVEAMDRLAKQRAEIVYGEIDRNKLFVGTAKEEDRSLMNLCFVMADEYKELEKEFLDFAVSKGMSDVFSFITTAYAAAAGDQGSFWGPIGVEYYYNISPTIGLGAVASYAGCKAEDEKTRKEDLTESYFTVMPSVKFNWLRKKNFGMYSALSAGVMFFSISCNDDAKKSDPNAKDESLTVFMFQATALGAEFGGEQFRGFVEAGVGEKGLLCAGLRYKF